MLLILRIFAACCVFPSALAVDLRFCLKVRSVRRFGLVLPLATLVLVCFTLAVGRSTALVGPQEKTPAAEIRSVPGRAEFTLDLNKKEPEELKFLIDSQAKMEGKLAIGAHAAVDYRSSDGKNIATHVVLVPDSGLRT